MTKMTSAYANKLLRQLGEDKGYWTRKEAESRAYVAAEGEVPVIPEYDYATVTTTISEIDNKVCAIKHAVNLSNATAAVDVTGEAMTVDQILIRMAQLNQRKLVLDVMRRMQPKERLSIRTMSVRNMVPEYEYINFELELVKNDFERVSNEIMQMQIALDYHNQTVEFEVDM